MAKKIIGSILQFNNNNITDLKNKLSTLILSNDIQTIQTTKDYQQLALRPSAKRFNALKQIEIKEKLINFQYKRRKDFYAFKNFRPENFNNWKNIEKNLN